jgi:hypothetical protein
MFIASFSFYIAVSTRACVPEVNKMGILRTALTLRRARLNLITVEEQ